MKNIFSRFTRLHTDSVSSQSAERILPYTGAQVKKTKKKYPVRLFLPLPPPPQFRLHHAVEFLLSSVDELIRTLLPVLPPTIVLPALLRPTPLLQTDLSLSSLQDLLSLRLALKRLKTNMEPSTVFLDRSLKTV